jgi:hypothetical protein
MTLLGFDKPLHAPEIEQFTRILMEAAEEITISTGGRPPVAAG